MLIIAALRDGEIGVGELVERLGVTKSALSHQLRSMRDKRLKVNAAAMTFVRVRNP